MAAAMAACQACLREWVGSDAQKQVRYSSDRGLATHVPASGSSARFGSQLMHCTPDVSQICTTNTLIRPTSPNLVPHRSSRYNHTNQYHDYNAFLRKHNTLISSSIFITVPRLIAQWPLDFYFDVPAMHLLRLTSAGQKAYPLKFNWRCRSCIDKIVQKHGIFSTQNLTSLL
jgi:hypothetical protein